MAFSLVNMSGQKRTAKASESSNSTSGNLPEKMRRVTTRSGSERTTKIIVQPLGWRLRGRGKIVTMSQRWNARSVFVSRRSCVAHGTLTVPTLLVPRIWGPLRSRIMLKQTCISTPYFFITRAARATLPSTRLSQRRLVRSTAKNSAHSSLIIGIELSKDVSCHFWWLSGQS